MLHNLQILNGELSPDFEETNNTYTVSVTSDVSSLKLIYTIDEEAVVEIKGNDNLGAGENMVLIEVTNENNELTTYSLLVTKEKTTTASSLLEPSIPVEVKKELPTYVAPLIACVCFVLILLSIALIFHKKRK